MADRRDPIDVFAEVARSLDSEKTLEATLQGIVEQAVLTVQGAQFASVSLIRARKQVETVAASDDICNRIDDAQYETGEGPCLDAIWDQETVLVNNLQATEQWPRFSQRAVDIGVCSILAFRLFVDDDKMGALNLYTGHADAFTDECPHLGAVFAAHAAVAWSHAREVQGLQAANETRALIGQAQGILMAQQTITAEAAFDLLREASQRGNTKLRDVAERVVETGALP